MLRVHGIVWAPRATSPRRPDGRCVHGDGVDAVGGQLFGWARPQARQAAQERTDDGTRPDGPAEHAVPIPRRCQTAGIVSVRVHRRRASRRGESSPCGHGRRRPSPMPRAADPSRRAHPGHEALSGAGSDSGIRTTTSPTSTLRRSPAAPHPRGDHALRRRRGRRHGEPRRVYVPVGRVDLTEGSTCSTPPRRTLAATRPRASRRRSASTHHAADDPLLQRRDRTVEQLEHDGFLSGWLVLLLRQRVRHDRHRLGDGERLQRHDGFDRGEPRRR